jgi:hypothetical protein
VRTRPEYAGHIDGGRYHAWAQPLALTRSDGTVEAVPGLCTIPHALPLPTIEPAAWLEYRLPPRLFTRFRCDVGLMAGIHPQAAATFEIQLDGRCLVRTDLLSPQRPAVPLDADIRKGRILRLVVRSDGSTDKLAFAVWGRPRLEKEASFA